MEAGRAEIVIDGQVTTLQDGGAALIPAGARHRVANVGATPLRLYTLYGPPEHRDGTVHGSPADARLKPEHFDGRTTETA